MAITLLLGGFYRAGGLELNAQRGVRSITSQAKTAGDNAVQGITRFFKEVTAGY